MQHDALPAVAHSPVDRNLCNSELAVSLFSTRDVTLGELWLGPEARTVAARFQARHTAPSQGVEVLPRGSRRRDFRCRKWRFCL
jgi:hypothetical protein